MRVILQNLVKERKIFVHLPCRGISKTLVEIGVFMNLVAVLYPCLIVIPTHIPINKTFITILTYLWDEYIYIILSGILIKRDVCDEIFSIFDVKIEKF